MKPRNDMKIELVECMGGDLSVVNSARRSFNQTSQEMGEKERGLIGFLMRNRHGTPFESSVFTFDVEVPISVAREWFRHRIGSFNEMSGRYTKLPGEFYLPERSAVRTQVGKPGSYSFERMPNVKAGAAVDAMSRVYDHAWQTYERLLEEGVAKELARQVLPVGLYTGFYWTVNARSLMNFLELRTAPNAMLEIRLAADKVMEKFETRMPVTARTFKENGRIAP